MRQRLGLAAALLGEPALLALDEPANGLDPAGVQWLRGALRSFAEGGGTALVSSHLLAEVAQSVDRVIILAHGRIVADAALDELGLPAQTLENAYLELTKAAANRWSGRRGHGLKCIRLRSISGAASRIRTCDPGLKRRPSGSPRTAAESRFEMESAYPRLLAVRGCPPMSSPVAVKTAVRSKEPPG